MKTSTLKDIQENLHILQGIAIEMVTNSKAREGDDTWESREINDMYFDFNIFAWENDEGQPVVNATVHPVEIDKDGFGDPDMSNFLRLAQKNVKTKKVYTLLSSTLENRLVPDIM